MTTQFPVPADLLALAVEAESAHVYGDPSLGDDVNEDRLRAVLAVVLPVAMARTLKNASDTLLTIDTPVEVLTGQIWAAMTLAGGAEVLQAAFQE